MLTERVVGAADGLGGAIGMGIISLNALARILNLNNLPGRSSSANDGDGAAGDSDLASERANDDAQETEEGSDGRRVGRLDAVAALERSSVALVAGAGARRRGGSKGCDGESSKSGEFELHDC